jgi:hypothetical protein
MVHAWWGITSFSSHCQTAPEPDFLWTAHRTQKSSQLACTIHWPQSYGFFVVGTPKGFGVFSADQQLTGIIAMGRKFLWGDSSETRHLRQDVHLCAVKTWRLCWNTWEPQGASAVKITQTSTPISADIGFWTYMLTGNLCSFNQTLYTLKACYSFFNALYVQVSGWQVSKIKQLYLRKHLVYTFMGYTITKGKLSKFSFSI